MIDYNQQMVERLEVRWLDPDCVDHYKDDEELWNRADDEWAERGNHDE